MNSWYETTGLGVMNAGSSRPSGIETGGLTVTGAVTGERTIQTLTAALSAGLRTRNYPALAAVLSKATPYITGGKPAMVPATSWSPFVLAYSTAQAAVEAAPAGATDPLLGHASPIKEDNDGGGGGFRVYDLDSDKAAQDAAAARAEAARLARVLEDRILALASTLGVLLRTKNYVALQAKVAEAKPQIVAGQRTVSTAVWNAFVTAYNGATAFLAGGDPNQQVKNEIDNAIDDNAQNSAQTYCEQQGGTWFGASGGCVYPQPQWDVPEVEPTEVTTPPPEDMSLTTKLLIGGGVVVAVGVGYYLLKDRNQGRSQNPGKVQVLINDSGAYEWVESNKLLYQAAPAEDRYGVWTAGVKRLRARDIPKDESAWLFRSEALREAEDWINAPPYEGYYEF